MDDNLDIQSLVYLVRVIIKSPDMNMSLDCCICRTNHQVLGSAKTRSCHGNIRCYATRRHTDKMLSGDVTTPQAKDAGHHGNEVLFGYRPAASLWPVVPSHVMQGIADARSNSMKTKDQLESVDQPSKRRIIDGTSQCIQTYCSHTAPAIDRITCILRFCNRSRRAFI